MENYSYDEDMINLSTYLTEHYSDHDIEMIGSVQWSIINVKVAEIQVGNVPYALNVCFSADGSGLVVTENDPEIEEPYSTAIGSFYSSPEDWDAENIERWVNDSMLMYSEDALRIVADPDGFSGTVHIHASEQDVAEAETDTQDATGANFCAEYVRDTNWGAEYVLRGSLAQIEYYLINYCSARLGYCAEIKHRALVHMM